MCLRVGDGSINMAYLAFSEVAAGLAPAEAAPRLADAVQPTARLSALEWAVVALAERDGLSSLRTPGRLSMALGALFGAGHNPRLADARLEALRRTAVLSWHHGYVVPSREVEQFLAAGFTPAQYELVVDSIGHARASRRRAARG